MSTTTQAPAIDTEDIKYVLAVHGMLPERDGRRKFTAEDLADGGATGTDMYDIACAWARTQTGSSFEWLAKVAAREAKGKAGTCGLTDKAAAGVLNCLVAAQRRGAAPVRPEPQPAPADDDLELEAHAAYDAWVRAQEAAADRAYQEHLAGRMAQGFYTVVDGAEHRTFKIGPWREDTYRAGGRIRWIGLLTGPDNTADYETVARQTSGGEVTMTGQYRNNAELAGRLAALMGQDVDGHQAARLAYAEASGRCARCGRMLTVPASLHAGLGPDCLAKMGGE